MTMRKKLIGLTATILATGAVFAFGAGIIGSTMASDEPGKFKNDSRQAVMDDNAGARSALTMEEILTRLEEQGYKEVYEVERERDVYEVKALDPKLGKVELYLDPGTGDILRREAHD
jgi:hypothetical protein